jgi:hypothetical protein
MGFGSRARRMSTALKLNAMPATRTNIWRGFGKEQQSRVGAGVSLDGILLLLA